ncbi:MAG: hypothetical protein M2R45_03702 [Verrucomicrobia subdivision 3 bacterium]|nr:hypothetical protein [Limisphaerales bacterium]MCS1414985.1 hypothetical protein [Limisphaerales bacterium]
MFPGSSKILTMFGNGTFGTAIRASYRILSSTGSILLGMGFLAGKLAAIDAPVDFSRQVLPILSDKCFVCHGPDAKEKDFLRLDSFEGATSDQGGYQAINPTDPEESELLARIHDADDPMPPEDAEKQLTDAERALLSQWVREGGEYAKHWAFIPPQRLSPPVRDGIQGGIDAFIAERMAEAEVDFAPEADRGTLARRVALILTGLPPELAQLEAFLADESPDAYERFVDELLSSPRYGEHQARYWLDAVRYGDTHGLHLDNRRGIYPYRDWVVKAFNDNLPLDDFITWQLAGDLLPNPTLEQELATGYVRMNPTTAEGGAIPLEFQAKNNFDRTENLGTVFLGMTLTCARCHTHKYDPITQREYYRLFAFFNSTAESSMDGNSYVYGPVVKVPENPTEWAGWERFLADRSRFLRETNLEEAVPSETIVAFAKARSDWETSEWKRSDIVDAGAPAPEGGEAWKDVQGLPGTVRWSSLPGVGKAVWIAFAVKVPEDLTLWMTLAGGAGCAVWVNEEALVAAQSDGDGRRQMLMPLTLTKGQNRVRIKIGGQATPGEIELRLKNPWTAVAKAKGLGSSDDEDRLLLLADALGPFKEMKQAATARIIAERYAAQASTLTTSLVARELTKPRETKVLRRGEYNLPVGEALQPGVLSVMGGLPENEERNRLGLARWLTSPEHPVVSRVLINRVWQRTFGYGLVRSPEDFGLQGQYPTHPKLLDWLAIELQESGWNLKHMLRLMVNSRTFRQVSKWRSDVEDSENRLFARGPSHRLDAEVLRDLGLWASGMLDPHIGGEGVKPYQPGGLWMALAHPASNTKQYVRDQGRRLYRRSLYIYWKRTSPHPMMTLFDAPSRESSCVWRSRTNTPLQSLGLLNETQRIEIARMFGERLLRERASDGERFELLFKLLASRAPTRQELTACQRLLEQMKQRYREAEDDAGALLSVGEVARDPSLNTVEHAAWTQVTTAVLATDVAILVY